jgi:quinol monooxygenase YgiN
MATQPTAARQYTQAHEPNCLSFVLTVDQKDPLVVFGTEHYATEHDFLEVHLKSAEATIWRAYINPLIEAGDVKVEKLCKGTSIESMGFQKR